MSVTSNYLFPVMNGLVKAVYEPSAAVLTLTTEELTEALAGLMHKLEDALKPTGCLVGDALTLADFYLIPHLKTAALTPQGANEINSWPAVVAWMQKLEQRPAYDRANPLVLG
jgi:glutathionyl-hydroquinone reductase